MPKLNPDRQAAILLRQCECSKIDVKFNDEDDLWFCFIWRDAKYYGLIRWDIVQVILEDRHRSGHNRFLKLKERLQQSADLTEKIQIPGEAVAAAGATDPAADLFRTAEDLIRQQEELCEELRAVLAKMKALSHERRTG